MPRPFHFLKLHAHLTIYGIIDANDLKKESANQISNVVRIHTFKWLWKAFDTIITNFTHGEFFGCPTGTHHSSIKY